MIKTLKKYIRGYLPSSPVKERDVVEAYDLWAENYDSQPGNLMLDLDESVFSKMLESISLSNLHIADIGCGTGRHWAKIFKKKPAGLTGFDVSPGMLEKLKTKYPAAKMNIITNNRFPNIPDHFYDVIISTLTVAHIRDIDEALSAWSRILRGNGDIIITDFHPDVLSLGGKRTFKHKKGYIAVQNYVHPTGIIKSMLSENGFDLISEDERRIDESVIHYYLEQNAIHVYEKFRGFPIIYGMHFRRRQ